MRPSEVPLVEQLIKDQETASEQGWLYQARLFARTLRWKRHQDRDVLPEVSRGRKSRQERFASLFDSIMATALVVDQDAAADGSVLLKTAAINVAVSDDAATQTPDYLLHFELNKVNQSRLDDSERTVTAVWSPVTVNDTETSEPLIETFTAADLRCTQVKGILESMRSLRGLEHSWRAYAAVKQPPTPAV